VGLQKAAMMDAAIHLPGAGDPTCDWFLVVDPTENIDDMYEMLSRESLGFFAKHYLGMIVDDLQLEWSELVSDHDRLSIQAARDHGKSAFFSYAYPIWMAWKHPDSLGYMLSASSDLAQDLLDIVKFGNQTLSGLYGHPKLGHLVGEQERTQAHKTGKTIGKLEWSKRQIRLTNGSVIRARGYGSRVRGGHPLWIVCDDVLDESDLYSEIQRDKRRTYFQTAIVSMVLKEGQIVVVGTPFHSEDLYSWLFQNERYQSRIYPGLIEDKEHGEWVDGKLMRSLWPQRHTVPELLDKKLEIGPVAFSREILCQPISDDLSLFPSYLFTSDVMAHHVPWSDPQWAFDNDMRVFVGVDLAISASAGSDYTVVMVLAADEHDNAYVIDGYRVRGKSFTEQQALILDVNARYLPSMIVIESNLMQRIFGDELIRTSGAPIKKFETRADNKNSLEKGVPGLRIKFENQKIRFSRSCSEAIEFTDKIIEELSQFGWFQNKLQGAGAHDDCVIALWLAHEGIRLGGFKFTFGTEGDLAPGAGNVVDIHTRARVVDPDRAALSSLQYRR
jgi:hypothetical protein